MRRIFKYPLAVTDRQTVDSFEGWKPLAVQLQYGTPFLWAEVDDEARPAVYRVFVHGTGHEVDRDARDYLGTFQIEHLVFHAYSEASGDARILEEDR